MKEVFPQGTTEEITQFEGGAIIVGAADVIAKIESGCIEAAEAIIGIKSYFPTVVFVEEANQELTEIRFPRMSEGQALVLVIGEGRTVLIGEGTRLVEFRQEEESLEIEGFYRFNPQLGAKEIEPVALADLLEGCQLKIIYGQLSVELKFRTQFIAGAKAQHGIADTETTVRFNSAVEDDRIGEIPIESLGFAGGVGALYKAFEDLQTQFIGYVPTQVMGA